MKELLTRTLTGISLLIVVIGSILTGPVPFLGMLMVLYGLGSRELLGLYSVRLAPPQLLMLLFAGLLLPATFFILQFQWNPLWLMLPVAGWIVTLLWSRSTVPSLLAILWLAIPVTCYFLLGYLGGNGNYTPRLPLMVMVLLWVNDTFAYLTGKVTGHHPMTPELSPGKTWEGLAGGILFTQLGGYLFSRITGEYAAGQWVLISLLISGAGLAGDLFESGLKRKHHIKDTGGILPGHGGILDRFDSLFFVAPVMAILFYILSRWP